MALDIGDNPATDAAKTVLGKKYGPLPLWGWLIIVTGTVYAVRRFQASKTRADNEANAEAATVGDSSTGTGTLVTPRSAAQSVYGGGGLNSATSGTVPSTDAGTNQQWLQRAVTLVSAQGTWDPYRVSTALQRYINGLLVTDPTDRAIVSQAITSTGAPPANPSAEGQGYGVDSSGAYIPDLQITRLIAGRINSDYGQPEYRPDGGLTDRANGGIYAQYTDGSIRWISNPQELLNILSTDPGLNAKGVENLAANDPVWARAIDGPDSKFR